MKDIDLLYFELFCVSFIIVFFFLLQENYLLTGIFLIPGIIFFKLWVYSIPGIDKENNEEKINWKKSLFRKRKKGGGWK